jgi:hypothetical protein
LSTIPLTAKVQRVWEAFLVKAARDDKEGVYQLAKKLLQLIEEEALKALETAQADTAVRTLLILKAARDDKEGIYQLAKRIVELAEREV